MQTLFKKFKILSVIKKTEQSAVYLADHIFLEKKIILKTLDADKAVDKSDRERFKREAKILASLNHPNIIRVYDFGTFKNFVYISFEYFEAQTLREVINKAKLNRGQKIDLLQQASRGLIYAHLNNIIHRDIKPENILVDKDHHLKIADFGLALSDDSRVLTNPQTVIGTPAYASPEQIAGASLTSASDLFSLGLVAYELFNNYNPFLGKDISQTINNVISYDNEKYQQLLDKTAESEKNVIAGLLHPEPEQRKVSDSFPEKAKANHKEQLPAAIKWVWIIPLATLVLVFVVYLILSNSPLAEKIESLNRQPFIADTANSDSDDVTHDTLQQPISKSKANVQPILDKTVVTVVEQQAQVQISINPQSILYINKQLFGIVSSIDLIDLPAGSHSLLIKNDSFPDYSRDIELQEGEKKLLTIDLAKQSGILKVFTHPWALLKIDGRDFGQTPLEKPIRLNKGSYTLQLKNPGFDTFIRTLKINGADTIVVQHNFVNPGLGTIIE